MAVIRSRDFSVSDLTNQLLHFDKNWRRSFSNGRAIYVATKNNAAITINNVTVKGRLIPIVIQRYKKGSRVVMIGIAVHNPPHTSLLLSR